MRYQIKVRGTLDESWSRWLGSVEITSVEENGSPITVIQTEIPDQPALFGILNRIRDLNLALISVTWLDQSCGQDGSKISTQEG
jgi:hypothetical protein